MRGTGVHTHTHTHTHIPVTSFLFIASPKASIFGLPLTAVIMSQTVNNASKVHFLFKHKCSFSFCRLGFLALVMSHSSPSSMILLCRRSPTTASASTSSMNRSRNWSRTSSAEWRRQNHATPTRQCFCSLQDRTLYHCLSDEWGSPINSEAITEWYCTRICYVVKSSMSSGDVTRQQCTVTMESCQSSQGGLAQQAGASYTRRASTHL